MCSMAEPGGMPGQQGIGACKAGLTGGHEPRLRCKRNGLPTTRKRFRQRAAIDRQLTLIDASAQGDPVRSYVRAITPAQLFAGA